MLKTPGLLHSQQAPPTKEFHGPSVELLGPVIKEGVVIIV
jgi:hypothetical protein